MPAGPGVESEDVRGGGTQVEAGQEETTGLGGLDEARDLLLDDVVAGQSVGRDEDDRGVGVVHPVVDLAVPVVPGPDLLVGPDEEGAFALERGKMGEKGVEEVLVLAAVAEVDLALGHGRGSGRLI